MRTVKLVWLFPLRPVAGVLDDLDPRIWNPCAQQFGLLGRPSAEVGAQPVRFRIVRLQQIAPVSSEMVLNHIAQHSLGLPRSY